MHPVASRTEKMSHIIELKPGNVVPHLINEWKVRRDVSDLLFRSCRIDKSRKLLESFHHDLLHRSLSSDAVL